MKYMVLVLFKLEVTANPQRQYNRHSCLNIIYTAPSLKLLQNIGQLQSAMHNSQTCEEMIQQHRKQTDETTHNLGNVKSNSTL